MTSNRAALALVASELLLLAFVVKFVGLSPHSAFWIIVAQGFIFGMLNGGNDAPNSVATLVATFAMTMAGALLVAAVFNFIGTISGEAVVKTIAKGIVPLKHLTANIAVAGAGGAIISASLATLRGLPISITHSLIGGILGAGIAAGLLSSGDPLAKIAWDPIMPHILLAIGVALGVGAMFGYFFGRPKKTHTEYYILMGCMICVGLTSSSIFAYTIYADIHVNLAKIALGITLAPFWSMIVGAVFASMLNSFVIRVFKNKTRHWMNELFRKLQWLSGSWLSFSHGWNDGQNIIAIMVFASLVGGYSEEIEVDWWLKLVAASSIALGTAVAGWLVMPTMAFNINKKMTPADGFAIQMSAAGINAIHTLKQIPFLGGVPISTTHAKGGSIMGAAVTKKLRYLNASTSTKMLGAWIFTVPFAAMWGVLIVYIFHAIGV